MWSNTIEDNLKKTAKQKRNPAVGTFGAVQGFDNSILSDQLRDVNNLTALRN